MFTDFYFTNLSTTGTHKQIVFYQEAITKLRNNTRHCIMIEQCQYNWSQKFRLYWDLSFRLIKRSGVITSPYQLQSCCVKHRKFFFVSKEGTIVMQQKYRCGDLILDFKQLKGTGFKTVQLYRGKIMVEEHQVDDGHINLQIESIIKVGIKNKDSNHDINTKLKEVLSFDFIGLKSVYIQLVENKKEGSKIQIGSINKW